MRLLRLDSGELLDGRARKSGKTLFFAPLANLFHGDWRGSDIA
jgi:hypothetical protein